jgi:HEAT repeat protein
MSVARAVAVVAVAAVAGGCSSAEEKRETTVQQLIAENYSLLRQLASYAAEEQQEAIRKFLRLGQAQGSEVVVWFLNDPKVVEDPRVQALLARILSEWKDPRAVPFLLESLKSEDDGVRRVATQGLMVFDQDRSLVDALGELLESSAAKVRLSAGEVLASYRGSLPAQSLLGRRLKVEANPEARGICLLGVADGPRGPARVGFLIDALGDSDPQIRATAWRVLRGEGAPDVFRPGDEAAARVDGILALRRWAGMKEERR